MMYTRFNQKTKFIQIPKPNDIKFLNTLCKLSHYQWFVLQSFLTWKIWFVHEKNVKLAKIWGFKKDKKPYFYNWSVRR
jgi:hypothetical protein